MAGSKVADGLKLLAAAGTQFAGAELSALVISPFTKFVEPGIGCRNAKMAVTRVELLQFLKMPVPNGIPPLFRQMVKTRFTRISGRFQFLPAPGRHRSVGQKLILVENPPVELAPGGIT